MKPLINISRLRLTSIEPWEELRTAVAKMEADIYKNLSGSDSAGNNLETLQAEIASLRGMILSLSVMVFPGFGTTHTTAAYGDHTHGQSSYFTKSGSQDAVLGANTVTFDTTYSYATIPDVLCWLEYSDGFWAAMVVDAANLTPSGFTVNVASIDNAPKIKYFAVGS